jgi:16S rRNA (cytosine967-C5)-methyltransferase
MKADPVRRLAHGILIAVAEGGHLDRELDAAQRSLPEVRDRAFLAELVKGTVQWQGRYDHLIKQFSRRKPPADVPTATLLRLALHQMLGMESVPAYAAIHQAGELCRRRPGPGKVGFVNGMLQSIRRDVLGDEPDGPTDTAASLERLRRHFRQEGGDPVAELAAWQSHPRWLVRRWVDHFGLEKAADICAWNNRTVQLNFHVLAPADPAAAAAGLADAGCPVDQGPGERTLTARQRVSRELLDEIMGRFPFLIVQDAAVQAATSWLAEGLADQENLEGAPVLDMCAAPGGKTAYLSSRIPAGTRILAMDSRRDRLDLLRATVDRVGSAQVDLLLADGLGPPFRRGSCGAVLLDGPCSGTGVLRHHPEGRWRLRKNTPERKARVLAELAARAAELLVPGGLLMYATCSVEPEENEKVVDSLLAGRDDLETAPDRTGRWRRQWLPGAGPDGVRGDGFFAARLRKKG